jgi:hypothetical protein
MKCSNCGSLNGDDVRFCEICGAALEKQLIPETQKSKTLAPSVPPVKQQKATKKKSFIPFIAGGGLLGAAVAVFFIVRAIFPSIGITDGKTDAAKVIGTQTIAYEDGVYEGDVKDGLPEGSGIYYYDEHPLYDFYTGEFHNGMMEGQGHLQMKEGNAVNWIEGSFAGGLPDGSAFASYNEDYLGSGGGGPFICECEFREGLLDGLYIERSEDGLRSAIGYFQGNEPIGIWFEFYDYETEVTDRNGITLYFEAGEPMPYDADYGGYDFSGYDFYDYYDEYPGFMESSEAVG